MSAKVSIRYEVASLSDYEGVLQFLRKHYYAHEPITVGYIHKKEPTKDDEDFSMSFLADGTVIKSIDENTGNIIGVSISGPIKPGDPEQMVEEAKTTETKKWADILKLLAYLEKTANVCERYNVEKCLHIHIIAVDTTYRGQAIGFNLTKEQLKLAQKLGYKLVSVDCTNVYTAKICEKLGMELVNAVVLSDYRDEHGIQLFRPPEPHHTTKTFISKL